MSPLVLIADNDDGVNAMLCQVLADRGLRCESARDGVAALSRLRLGGIAVLVTDLDMPELDGRELLRQLAEIDRMPWTLVISGYLDADVERTLRAQPGVRHILHKPFDVMEFAELVLALAGSAPPG